MIDLTNPRMEDFARAGGLSALTAADTYRGWTIHQGGWPAPAWSATGPGYDAWTEGEGEWADNGESANAPTRDALIAEIDAWFDEHGEPTDLADAIREQLREGDRAQYGAEVRS